MLTFRDSPRKVASKIDYRLLNSVPLWYCSQYRPVLLLPSCPGIARNYFRQTTPPPLRRPRPAASGNPCRWCDGCLLPAPVAEKPKLYGVLFSSHVQRLCPHCSRPGFNSWLGTLCCVSLPLSLILSPVKKVFSYPINKAKKILKKNPSSIACHAPTAPDKL